MQRITALGIAAHPGYEQRAHVSPSALVQCFVNVDVLRFLFAVIRSIGWNTDSLGRTFSMALNFPAVLGQADINLVPKRSVPYFVCFVKIVYVKAANVGSNFPGAMVTPMLFNVPNGVTMGAWVATIVTFILKLSLVEIINETNKAKKLWLKGVVQVCHDN